MQTHLDRLITAVRALRADAARLEGSDHEPADCAALLKDAGGRLEVFLKQHIYTSPSQPKAGLAKLITGLGQLAIPPADVSDLHVLRKRYNAAKHEPTYEPTTDEVVDALERALGVLERMRGKGLGTSETQAAVKYRRRLWLASWDHYVHGDGEVQIIAPSDALECDFPVSVDTIYLRGLSWPTVLEPLGKAVRPAEGVIPTKFLEMWEREGDFAGARVFEGEYRELLRVLARSELRLELIPSMKREDDSAAMRAGLAFAAIDVAVSESVEKSDVVEAILQCGDTDYAVPRTADLAKQYAAEFGELLARVPQHVWRSLSGPRFVAERKYRELQLGSLARNEATLITTAPELVLKV